MSAPRIGDRGFAPPAAESSSRPSTAGERFRSALASPVGILLVVPGLVVAVGAFLTFLGQGALERISERLGRERMAEQTGFAARSIATALGNADSMLDRMRELAAKRTAADPPAPLAHALRAMIEARAGVAFASVSYPDGTFQGAYRDTDGVVRFQVSHVGENGTRTERYDIVGTDALAPRKVELTAYDPRVRDFYRLAVDKRQRVWTDPYPFYRTHYTGVTRVEAVRDAAGAIHAVITADLDVNALSSSMASSPFAGARTLLYTRDGVVLAYPEGRKAIEQLPLRGDRPLLHEDLKDPVIDALLERTTTALRGDLERFTVNGEAQLATITDVPRHPELSWIVAVVVPERIFFAALSQYRRQSLLVAAIGLALSLGIAVVFARHVVKARKDVARARDLAREATERARELGSYRLVERLGVGGMGEVWRAEHRLLMRQAAIKLIRPEALESSELPSAELLERFRREAQTLASLRSRHTIELFDYGVAGDGTFFFVMELLDGVDLETLVERYGPQPVGRVVHLLVQASRSLAEAHRAGLVHRDVKPANLFVCRAADEVDVVKVLDFGLVQTRHRRLDTDEMIPIGDRPTESVVAPIGDRATESVVTPIGDRATERAGREPVAGAKAESHVGRTSPPRAPAGDGRLTRAGQYLGTPAFMAPEQILGQEVDGRADLYALGCVAVWLLTGEPVFEAPTAMALLVAHMTNPVPDLRARIRGYYPEALDQVLRRCLEKSRADRFEDARAFAEALSAIELPDEERWTDRRARAWWDEVLQREVPRGDPSQRKTFERKRA